MGRGLVASVTPRGMPMNEIPRPRKWLPHKDSNLNKQIQNLRCYHYTMRQ